MFNLIDYQQKASIEYQKALDELPPAGGNGYHLAILGVANHGVWSGRTDEQIINDIRSHTREEGRNVPDEEIRSTVEHARLDYDNKKLKKSITNSQNAYINQRVILKDIKHDEELCKWLCERFNIPPTTDDDIAKYESPRRIIDGLNCDDLINEYPHCAESLVLLNTLYHDDDFVFIGGDNDSGRNVQKIRDWRKQITGNLKQANKLCGDKRKQFMEQMGEWYSKIILNPLDGKAQPKKTTPQETSKRGDNNVVFPVRFALFESDFLPIAEQWRMGVLLGKMGFKIKAVISSGGKSLHFWLDISAVKTADEWKSLVHDRLFSCLCRLGADGACASLARLGRFAGVLRKLKDEKLNPQRLMWIDEQGQQADDLKKAVETLEQSIRMFDMKRTAKEHTQERPEDTITQTEWHVTTDNVKNAIDGTALGELTSIFSSVTNPPLNVKIGLYKALALAGLCTSGRREIDEADTPQKERKTALKLHGAQMARLTTSTGLLMNCYTLLVAPSSTGKDIGRLLPSIANQLDLEIGTDTNAEGWKDALVNKPNGLLTISELSSYIDTKNAQQGGVINTMTNYFDAGHFKDLLSTRTKAARECPQRKADYIAPNVTAAIQPKILERKASIDLVFQGFLSRFFIFNLEDDEIDIYACPASFDYSKIMERLMDLAKCFMRKFGVIHIPDDYATRFLNLFPPNERGAGNSYLLRLCREHCLRLAVWLSVKADDSSPIVELTEDVWRRTEVLVKWFYSMAKSVIGNISDMSDADRQEVQCVEEMEKYMEKWASVTGGRYSKSEIAKTFWRKGAPTRNRALETLEDKGFIIRQFDEKSKAVFYVMTKYLPKDM